METVLLSDLLSLGELNDMITQKYVRVQAHPVLPLSIFNYTEHAQFDRMWNDVTRLCRGLIIHHGEGDDVVIARSFSKFFNHGEPDAPALDLDAPAHVSDKMDGSLGILYPLGDSPAVIHPGSFSVASRGSFMSEQAQRASKMLREKYPHYRPLDGVTTLVEIVYPANRIVLDYEDREDLFLLGGVDIATGTIFSPDMIPGWTGPVTEVMAAKTLREALLLPPRPNREGLVIRAGYDMVKVKQDDYVALHRILTTTSARNIWEYLAVNACKDLITAPKKWGNLLGLDPARAQGIIEAGDGWMDKMIHGVPDEFYGWFRKTVDDLILKVDDARAEVERVFAEVSARHEGDRKGFALDVKDHPLSGALFLMLDGRDITASLWKNAYPPAERPWGQRSEDVA